MSKPVRSLYVPRGATLIGMLFWSVVVVSAALLVIKVVPTINEYMTIQAAVSKIALQATSAQEVRTAFEKQKQIEYTIDTIGGKDLIVTKENEKLVVSFAYDKEIALFGPVFLLIKYNGRSK